VLTAFAVFLLVVSWSIGGALPATGHRPDVGAAG